MSVEFPGVRAIGGLRLAKLKASDANCTLRALSIRIQALLLFFIDGASMIDHDDPKWVLNFLYLSQPLCLWCRLDDRNVVLGYASEYRFLLFPDKVRLRISQFWILPGRQGTGLGTQLYHQLMCDAQVDLDVREVTVEDPSEAFADLRLLADLRFGHRKLTTLQASQVHLLQRFQTLFALPQDDWADFTRSVKLMLLKKYPDCVPLNNREEKVQVLSKLYDSEVAYYRKLLKLQ